MSSKEKPPITGQTNSLIHYAHTHTFTYACTLTHSEFKAVMTANVVNISQVYFVVSAVSQVSDNNIIKLLFLVSLLPLKADNFQSIYIVRVSPDIWHH